MLANLRALWASDEGSAAAEMALVAPLLIVLMFGSFETGRYFLDEHVVVKAVRDGARYASRQGFADYTCPGGAASAAAITRTRDIVRFGKLNATVGDLPRLSYWQATSDGQPSVQVTVTCPTTLNGTEVQGGLYAEKANIPVVTVSAVVEYESLFGLFGFGGGVLNVAAESQSAVMGT
jgi:Flp pilus assembly protein TadG